VREKKSELQGINSQYQLGIARNKVRITQILTKIKSELQIIKLGIVRKMPELCDINSEL